MSAWGRVLARPFPPIARGEPDRLDIGQAPPLFSRPVLEEESAGLLRWEVMVTTLWPSLSRSGWTKARSMAPR